MYLIIENIQEQFELYFNHEKNIELIKKWAIRYIGYGEDLCFLSNEKYIVKWLEIFKNISDEIKDTDMRKLYNEFLEDLKKINIEYDKNVDELTKKYKEENLEIYNYKGVTLGDNIKKIYPLMKIYHTEYSEHGIEEEYSLITKIENSYIFIDIYSRKVIKIEIYDEGYALGEFKIGSEITTELCDKYELLDLDDVDTGEICYFPQKNYMHAVIYVNPEDDVSKITKIVFSINGENPSKNNVKDILKAKKIEDIYYSLYNFGKIEIDIKNKEIIGRLEGNTFIFDLFNGNLIDIKFKE